MSHPSGHTCPCPGCGYDLRAGVIDPIRCPECGRTWPLAWLQEKDGQPAWFRAPALNRIMSPVAWIACWIAFSPILVGFLQSRGIVPSDSGVAAMAGALAVGVAVWILMMLALPAFCPVKGCRRLAFQAHGVFLGYVSGLAIMMGGLTMLMEDQATLQSRIVAVAIAGPAVAGLLWVSRHLERSIARACLLDAADRTFAKADCIVG